MPNYLKHKHARKRGSYRQNKLYATKGWRKLRMAIINRRGGQCVECGSTPLDQHIHLDHIKPLAEGGEAFNEENIQILCRACHGRKTAKEVWGVGAISKEDTGSSHASNEIFVPNT